MPAPHSERRTALRLGGAALLLAALFAPWACTKDPGGTPVANLRPHVRVTGGPLEGTRDSYKAKLLWTGWDDDGEVVGYEYAVDPPSAFTRDEIAFPESHPELTRLVLRGRDEEGDTVRVVKAVGDSTVWFDYIGILQTDVSLTLTSSRPDSVLVGTRYVPGSTASDPHVVYLRALDNEGTYSDIDRIAFTAVTYTPEAFISYPYIQNREFLRVGDEIRLAWSGYDEDAPGTDPRPPGYYIKLVDLKKLPIPLSVLSTFDPETVLYDLAKNIPWEYRSADSTTLRVKLERSDYLFAVRAVDAVGAVEPFVDLHRPGRPANAVKFVSSPLEGRPNLTVHEPTLGTFPSVSGSGHYEVEAPVGIGLRFQWTGSAETYGGQIIGFSYGLDIEDLENEGPRSGWSPWGKFTTMPDPLVFTDPGYHVLYVRVRDSDGKVNMVSVGISAFTTPLDRKVLLVDDYRNDAYPKDVDHDAFWTQLVAASGRVPAAEQAPNILWYDTGGVDDKLYLNNTPPRLSRLGRYKTAVWILNGSGWCGYTSFLQAGPMGSLLRTYLEIGGQIWVVGSSTLVATRRAQYDCNDPEQPFHDRRAPILPRGELEYPHSYAPGDFAYDFLHLATNLADNDKGQNWEHGMLGVRAWNPDDPIFPAMRVDGNKFSAITWQFRALDFCDAIFEPISVQGSYARPGVMDSLYSYIAAVEERPTKNKNLRQSRYSNQLCAVRWHDPAPDPEQGRVMWFGFPLYYMMTEQAQETFNRALDWFDEN